MKKLLAIIATAIAMPAFAGDFNTGEFNVKLQMDKVGVEVRETVNSDADHIELSYAPIDGATVAYRYVDTADKEHRLIAGYEFGFGILAFEPTVEYRNFNAGADHYRVIPAIKAKHETGAFTIYAAFEPKFEFNKAGSTDDAKMDESESKIGFDYKFSNNVSFGPYIQYETDGDWNKTNTLIGTNLKVTF